MNKTQGYPACFSCNTIAVIRQKEQYHKNYKKHKFHFYLTDFRRLRIETKIQIDNDYKIFILNAHDNITGDTKQVSNFMRRIPAVMKDNCSSLHQKETEILNFLLCSLQAFIRFQLGNCSIQIAEADMLLVTKRLKNKFIVDPDQIPSYLVKGCCATISTFESDNQFNS